MQQCPTRWFQYSLSQPVATNGYANEIIIVSIAKIMDTATILLSEIKDSFGDAGMYLNGDTGTNLLMVHPPFSTLDKPRYRPH
jgi:hypothetical protein